ncbi:MAG: CAP domain-containing protein [Myxococcota bacterium]
MRWLLASLGIALFVSAADAQRCEAEDVLHEAAATLLLEGELSAASIRNALREASSDLPHARARVFPKGANPEGWMLQLGGDGVLVCGHAETEESALWLIARRSGALRIDGDDFIAELEQGFEDPYLAVRDAGGRMLRLSTDIGAPIDLPGDLDAPIEVQLVATGSDGPRPVATRRIGTALAALPDVALGEGGLGAYLRALRAAHNRPELRENRLLEREARRHANQICRDRRAAHSAEGDPTQRLRERGISARVVGEVIARAEDDQAAFSALLASNSHRMAMVDRRFTDVGIARREQGGGVCVVMTFAAWPRFVGR